MAFFSIITMHSDFPGGSRTEIPDRFFFVPLVLLFDGLYSVQSLLQDDVCAVVVSRHAGAACAAVQRTCRPTGTVVYIRQLAIDLP